MFRRIAQLVIFAALIGLFVFMRPAPSRSASYRVDRFLLWNGARFDSTRHVKWFDVSHTSHVTLRTWTTKTAYVANAGAEADSAFTDSIATFEVLFSDSVSFMARDSAGTVVTSNSGIPRTSDHGDPYPICADSISVGTLTATGFVVDTVKTLVGVHHAPVNIDLRAPATGSGAVTGIYPLIPGGAAVYGDGEIRKRYIGIAVTPLRRSTAQTKSATFPNRVNGLKGFRLEVTKYTQDER